MGLNLPSAVSCKFTANSPNITVSGTAPAVGTNVCFNNGNANIFSTSGAMPAGIVQCQPYYVVSKSGSAIQVSLTSGGSAITPTTAGVGSGYMQLLHCFIVTAVSGNQVTINFNTTGQPAYMSGGTLTYTFSQSLSNNIRWAGKFTNALGTANTAMNAQWAANTSSGFVMENVSNFTYVGPDNVWAVLDPNIYAPNTPQWNSIVAAN